MCSVSFPRGAAFFKAVPAGEQLCTGLATLVVNRTELLKTGDAKGALVDLDNESIVIKGNSVKTERQRND